MPSSRYAIPVHTAAELPAGGLMIGKVAATDAHIFGEAMQYHRDDYHLFLLQEDGITALEVDFQHYRIESFSMMYIHPHQVHRWEPGYRGTASFWMLSDENISPDNLALLKGLMPAKPVHLAPAVFTLVSEAISLSIKLSERKQDTFYYPVLRKSCDLLVALAASAYEQQEQTGVPLSRYEEVTKAFRAVLDCSFTTAKRPAAYAQALYPLPE